MRRVLVVAYHFPPEPAAGALRPGYLARYLRDFGWEPVVLTRPLGAPPQADCTIVTAPVLGESAERWVRAKAVNGAAPSAAANGRVSPRRKLLRLLKHAVAFPDRASGWILPAAIAGCRAIRCRRVDAVLSTAPPPSVHLVGAALATLAGVPWIADYRDLWYGNPTSPNGPARIAVERLLEKALLRRAEAITTVSQALADRLAALHCRGAAVIPNAQDPAEWDEHAPQPPQGFDLCYTGSMYDGARTPVLLFEALARLRDEGDPAGDARIHFYGPNSAHIPALAERYRIAERVIAHGTVPRPQALAAQRSASNLLVFLNMDESTSHELGSKVFEYLGARRPILAFGPPKSVMRDYLAQRELGWFAGTVDEAAQALRAAHRRWLSGTYDVAVPPGTVFEARDLARAFAGELDAAVTRAPRESA